jgi:hypothetical protein
MTKGLSKYYLAIILLITLAVHIYHRTQGLTAWKGGGFGMYSTYHPTNVIIYTDTVLYQSKKNKAIDLLMNKFLYYPNTTNQQALQKIFRDSTHYTKIQVYNIETNHQLQLYKKLQYEILVGQ